MTLEQDGPLFSIIMPNYNKAKYIREAIESVLSQTYTNWELIIVDDCSNDESLDVVKPFLENKKIKFIKNKTNQGVAQTARNAVENSSGEIIGTLDSDDVLHEDALKIMVEEYKKHPECGLIYSNHYICDNNLTIHDKAAWLDLRLDDICLQDILLGSQDGLTVSMHFRTFKKSAYEKTDGYDAALLCYEDRDLYYKLEKVTKIRGIDICLYYYRHTYEMGAYRQNPKERYFWFVCAYKETHRRFGNKLPFVNRETISPFLSNIMYIYLCKYSKVKKDILRTKIRFFLLGMGYDNLSKNKFLTALYFLNSYFYGYTPITFSKIKKFSVPAGSVK